MFGQDGAARHEVHSEADRGSERLRLDIKSARIDKHFNRDNAHETWHNNVRTYLLGTDNDMVLILDWIDARGTEVITEAALRQMQEDTMIYLDPLQVARELWSWVNLTLEHSASAQRAFHTVQALGGTEVFQFLS